MGAKVCWILLCQPIKLWIVFPIVSYSECSWVRVGQKEESAQDWKAEVKQRNCSQKSCGKILLRTGEEVPSGPQLSSTLHPACLLIHWFHQPPNVWLQWDTAATSQASLPDCPFSVPLGQLDVIALQISLQAHLFSHLVYQADWLVTPQSSLADLYFPGPPTTGQSLVSAKEISSLRNSKCPYYCDW